MPQILASVSQDEKISLLTEALKEKSLLHDFDHATFGVWNLPGNISFAATTYPKAWAKHYADNNYQDHDPALQVSFRATSPVDWEMLKAFDTHGILETAEAWGLGNHGLSIPVKGGHGETALLSVVKICSSEQWEEFKSAKLNALEMIAVELHLIALETWGVQTETGYGKLEQREQKILELSALGRSPKEIAEERSISSDLVEKLLSNTRDKLCAHSTSQAISRAIGLKLISPS